MEWMESGRKEREGSKRAERDGDCPHSHIKSQRLWFVVSFAKFYIKLWA